MRVKQTAGVVGSGAAAGAATAAAAAGAPAAAGDLGLRVAAQRPREQQPVDVFGWPPCIPQLSKGPGDMVVLRPDPTRRAPLYMGALLLQTMEERAERLEHQGYDASQQPGPFGDFFDWVPLIDSASWLERRALTSFSGDGPGIFELGLLRPGEPSSAMRVVYVARAPSSIAVSLHSIQTREELRPQVSLALGQGFVVYARGVVVNANRGNAIARKLISMFDYAWCDSEPYSDEPFRMNQPDPATVVHLPALVTFGVGRGPAVVAFTLDGSVTRDQLRYAYLGKTVPPFLYAYEEFMNAEQRQIILRAYLMSAHVDEGSIFRSPQELLRAKQWSSSFFMGRIHVPGSDATVPLNRLFDGVKPNFVVDGPAGRDACLAAARAILRALPEPFLGMVRFELRHIFDPDEGRKSLLLPPDAAATVDAMLIGSATGGAAATPAAAGPGTPATATTAAKAAAAPASGTAAEGDETATHATRGGLAVHRVDLKDLEADGRRHASSLVTAEGLVRTGPLARFVREQPANVVRAALVAFPYRSLEALARHVPLPGTEDVPWSELLTEYVVDMCMKRCEFTVRRARLAMLRGAGGMLPDYSPQASGAAGTGPDSRPPGLPTTDAHGHYVPARAALGFESVFDDATGKLSPAFVVRELTPSELEHPNVRLEPTGSWTIPWPAVGQPSAVRHRRWFDRNFRAICGMTPKELGLSPTCMVMGGAVLAALAPMPPAVTELHEDMDFWDRLPSLLGFPQGLGVYFMQFVGDYAAAESRTRQGLVDYFRLHSGFSESDIDLFVTAPLGMVSGDVAQAAEASAALVARHIVSGGRVWDDEEDTMEQNKNVANRMGAMRAPFAPPKPSRRVAVPAGAGPAAAGAAPAAAPKPTKKTAAPKKVAARKRRGDDDDDDDDDEEEEEEEDEDEKEEDEEDAGAGIQGLAGQFAAMGLEEFAVRRGAAGALPDKAKFCYYVRSRTALTLCGLVAQRNVQIVPVQGRTAEDALMDFDLDAACFAYDGTHVWCLPRARRAFNTGTQFLDPFILRFRRSRTRAAKYARRGFGVLLLEACRHQPRCDVVLDAEVRGIWDRLCAEIDSRRSDPDAKDPAVVARLLDSTARLPAVSDKLAESNTTESEDGAEPADDDSAAAATAATSKGASGPPDFNGSEWESDQVFYSSDCVPTYAIGPVHVANRITKFLRSEQSKANEAGVPFVPRFVHGEDLDFVLSQPLPPAPPAADAIKVGAQAGRVSHACHMCGQRTEGEFNEVLCASCAGRNRKAREARADMTGLVALVTGARIKIGHATALRLLRMGATVVGTTRFPALAWQQFSREPDSASWRDRLFLYGLDLRAIPALVRFLHHFASRFGRVDVIINNAAQTVRRPPAYYRELVEQEAALRVSSPPQVVAALPAVDGEHVDDSSLAAAVMARSTGGAPAGAGQVTSTPGALLSSRPGWSAEATQLAVLPGDEVRRDDQLFPPGQRNEFGEPVDLRGTTTWNVRLQELEYGEVLEAQLVNATAPCVILSELASLLRRHDDEANLAQRQRRKFVVNVSSPEGQFFTVYTKRGVHPHTNMAKAALNMLTRTVAADLVRECVYVTAVDPGWVSDMRPAWATDQSGAVNPPLTVEDGAARVLDPVISGLTLSDAPLYGVFLRNFEVEPW